MAIATYADLKTAVASWLHRSDLTTQIPDFIALAESRLRNDVRCRAMEQTSTGSLSATTVAFPTRLAETRRVMLDNDPLYYMDPVAFQQNEYGNYGAYTLNGQNFVFPKAAGTYSIDYYQWFAPFSSGTDTNWLLTNHPDIYLYSAIMEGALYVREEFGMWEQKYRAALARLRAAEFNHGGPMQVRPMAVV